MSAPQPSLPPSCFLAAAGGLGGDGGDDSPRRRHSLSTHAVDANPAFLDEEENPDPNPNDGNNYDPTSAAFVGAALWRKKKRSGITSTLRCPVCGKEFANRKALHGHMRCHPDRAWREITPPALQPESEEVAASSVRLSGREGAWPALQPEREEVAASSVKLSGREGAWVCSQCGRAFDTWQGLGGHRASHSSVKGCHAKSTYKGRNGNGDHGVRNDRPGGHAGKGGIQMKIGQSRRRGRWKTLAEAVAETVKEAVAVETTKEIVTDMMVQQEEEEAEVVSKTAEEVAAVEAVAERRGLPLDLNLPAPPEDKNDDPSAGIIDLNKKLPGQDDE